MSFRAAAALLHEGVAGRAYPGAAVEVGRTAGPLWRYRVGSLTYEPDAPAVEESTIYDLASLTKVLATTTLAMRAVDDGRLAIEEPVAGRLKAWRGEDREAVTIGHLLDHSSGLTAYLPFYRDYTGRLEFEEAICRVPLEYAPGTTSIYSDLGFMLLGFILEDAAARRAGGREDAAAPRADGRKDAGTLRGAPGAVDPSLSLAAQFRRVATYLTASPLAFNPPRAWRARCAPTEVDPWRGRLLAGEVHDENAWALNGAAGHAGVFGTADAVGTFARTMLATIAGEPILASSATAQRFIGRTGVPGSSRALGWDTMLPTSSCGTRLSPTAIGHTGFTGTSLWIDWERDLYIVLLTNRVHPTRDNARFRQLRPRIHDAIAEAVRLDARPR